MKHIKYIYLVFILLFFNACYPDSSIYPEETDLVYTNFGPGVDFTNIKYYKMHDSVLRISEEGEKDRYFSDYDELLMSHFEHNLQLRGFVNVDEHDSLRADVLVVISDLSYVQINYYWNYIPYGYFYPNDYNEAMNAFYPLPPPSMVTYSTSSYVMVDMLEYHSSESHDSLQIYWRGIGEGMLTPNMESRWVNNIDRMFLQSPYLKALNK